MNRENREILFRGQRLDNDEWAYGDLLHLPNGDVVILSDKGYTKVKPATVGQFTGLTDKNGKKIFKGDIVKCLSLEYGYVNKEVYYAEDRARFVLGSLGSDYDFEEYIKVEVIGNIYDNPELLYNGD